MSNVMSIVRGAEFRAGFVWNDAAGAARDATGATVTAYLRHPWSHTKYDPVITAAWSNAASGLGEVSMDEAQTMLIDRGQLSEMVVEVVSTGAVTDIFVGGLVEGV